MKEAIKYAEDALRGSRKSYSSAQFPLVVKYFVDIVLEEVIPEHGNEFVEYLYASRYAHLVQMKQLPLSSKTPMCSDVEDLQRKVLKSLKNDWKSAIESIADLFGQLPSDAGSVWLGNFIEAIISVASGAPQIGYYLQDCYYSEQ